LTFASRKKYTPDAKVALHQARGDVVRNRVRELRSEAGLTQEEVAQKVGVSRQTIISIESGRYNPSILLAYKLAKVFSRSIEEVFLCREELEEEGHNEQQR
jgi:putative transcriptional regulator